MGGRAFHKLTAEEAGRAHIHTSSRNCEYGWWWMIELRAPKATWLHSCYWLRDKILGRYTFFGFWATDGSLGWWKLITLVLRVCFPVNLWCHVSTVWVLPAAQKQISLVIISVLSDTTSLLCDIRSLYLILGAYSQNVEEVVTKS